MKFAACIRLHLLLALAAVATTQAASDVDYGAVTSAVAQIFEEGHYSGQRLNVEISRRFLANYLDDLDQDHLYFTRQDIEEITRDHADTLGRDAQDGKTGAALEIFDLYKKRVNERVKKIEAALKKGVDFTSARTVELNRGHSPWPADNEEADKLWDDQIASELLDEKLAGTKDDECVKIVANRYNQSLEELLDAPQGAGALPVFLNALARTYDPHSEYLRKEDMEDLDSDMRLSMVGIGVVIEGDGQYVRIVSVLPGSPAAVDGRIKPNDRILAIAKENGDYVDIGGMGIDHVLALMRSKAGTKVRLKVTASRGADSSEHRDVDLVSGNIELVDDEAKGEVIERTNADGKKERLGWITLPSFYGDPDHPHGKSLTRDMRNLLTQLKSENVSGIVLDMRNNPGGELEEAVGVGGLFLGPVPVVQEKDRDGKIYVSKADGRAVYDGPLVVLTDHMTASAAELLGGALQDYGRAVLVGGHYSTFGKGSVQTVVEVADMIESARKRNNDRDSDQLGAVQLTIAKFYRVNGQSTQLRGLLSDIQLPSPEDLPDDGEASMKNPLMYDETKPVRSFDKNSTHTLPIAELRALSAGRIAADQEFRYLAEDIDRETKKDEANQLSLNEATRQAELDEEKARDKQRADERKLRKPPEETKIGRASCRERV